MPSVMSWLLSILVSLLSLMAPQTGGAVMTVPKVDLDRPLGDWYEVAKYPNWFQRFCIGDVVASYARRNDGRISVANRCRTADKRTRAEGVARVVDMESNARLKVRFAPAVLSFLPFVWGDYWVIGLADDYQSRRRTCAGDPSAERLAQDDNRCA
ncbi:MAG: lipocalin family protein [Acidobacteriota bacterium]